MTEDEMVGWYHWLDGHEFEQASGVGDGQGSLACCSPWGHKESDVTERLNWTELDEHSHPFHSSKLEVYQAVADIKEVSANSQWPSRVLIIDFLANLGTTASPLRLSLPNLSCSIRIWRQKNPVPSIPPPRRNGYMIPNEYKFLKNGTIFFCIY